MGGNVFRGITTSIKKEFIEPTLKEYFKELDFILDFNFESYYTKLGSAGKKDLSGDIDLGIDVSIFQNFEEVLRKFQLDEILYAKNLAQFTKRAKTASERQLQLRSLLYCLGSKISGNSLLIQIELKKITAGNIFTCFPIFDENGIQTEDFVQIDWMVGNLDWLKFSYYSEVYEGNVKGLHRTQLLLSMFNYKGFTFEHLNGVRSTETREVFATNSKEAKNLLSNIYHKVLEDKVADNYFLLINYLESVLSYSEFLEVMKIYFKILDSTRCDIPYNLQTLWKNKQKEWGLEGKYLPVDSYIFL